LVVVVKKRGKDAFFLLLLPHLSFVFSFLCLCERFFPFLDVGPFWLRKRGGEEERKVEEEESSEGVEREKKKEEKKNSFESTLLHFPYSL
jgi:hypothetical protein